MGSSTQWRVVSRTGKVRRYAEMCGRYENGKVMWRWVSHHGTLTRFDRADAETIVEVAKACGERMAKLEKAA